MFLLLKFDWHNPSHLFPVLLVVALVILCIWDFFRAKPEPGSDKLADGVTGILGTVATVWLASNEEQKAKMKRGFKKIAPFLLSTERLSNLNTKAAYVNSISISDQATQDGITPASREELQKERIKGEIKLDEDRQKTDDLIKAGFQVNTAAFQRQNQLLDEIRQLDKRLKDPDISRTEKSLIRKQIQTKKAEHERLGQNPV